VLTAEARDGGVVFVVLCTRQEFSGTWRMQQAAQQGGQQGGEPETRLSYAARVQPQPWLPARLIESRVTQVRALFG